MTLSLNEYINNEIACTNDCNVSISNKTKVSSLFIILTVNGRTQYELDKPVNRMNLAQQFTSNANNMEFCLNSM